MKAHRAYTLGLGLVFSWMTFNKRQHERPLEIRRHRKPVQPRAKSRKSRRKH